jgi:hypothetical protein
MVYFQKSPDKKIVDLDAEPPILNVSDYSTLTVSSVPVFPIKERQWADPAHLLLELQHP